MAVNASQLIEKTISFLPYTPNQWQMTLISSLSSFVTTRGPRDVFLLNGYAGTGKTSIVGALVKAMDELKLKSVILAPTGRAAKVASEYSSKPASTIHKRIFRGNSVDPGNMNFFLAENRTSDAVFFIDEASMISDQSDSTRSLLSLLCHHVYSAPGNAMIFIGDIAQLPPVGQTESLAMNPQRLLKLGLNPVSYSLTTPARQAKESGLLYNATVIRHFIFSKFPPYKFRMFATGFPDVQVTDFSEFIDKLSASWASVGIEETLIITRSNIRANKINNAIRGRIRFAESPLERGDRVVISKNDYYWSKINKISTFIANGDVGEVTWVGRTEKKYGRWFADIELRFPNLEATFAAKVMLRSLASEGPAIPRLEMERLYNVVLDSYEGELSHKIKGAIEDPYYNALQMKYAYCVTCHKAQGGQWKHVYIDLSSISEEAYGTDFFRWLYTAVTRATDKIFLINPTMRVV